MGCTDKAFIYTAFIPTGKCGRSASKRTDAQEIPSFMYGTLACSVFVGERRDKETYGK